MTFAAKALVMYIMVHKEPECLPEHLWGRECGGGGGGGGGGIVAPLHSWSEISEWSTHSSPKYNTELISVVQFKPHYFRDFLKTQNIL